jgi:serine/threonine-protein kinase
VERIGNYRIEGVWHRDATRIAYEGRHLVLPRRAIVEVMHDPATSVQLLREACILEALEHPGIPKVFESGLLADRRPWFAHECIGGAPVTDLLQAGALDLATAAGLLRDIAAIVDHAHRRGVVHGRLRPDCIVVTGRARSFPLCIADWSDARAHDTASPAPVLGPIDYAAPELVNGEALDDRADVFALGVIAYQALTGHLPFELAYVPTDVRCDAPPNLAALVDQMLAWERWDRPTSAEVHAELATVAEDLAEPPSALRIRRPKWTPALDFDDVRAARVAAEIDDTADTKPTKSS